MTVQLDSKRLAKKVAMYAAAGTAMTVGSVNMAEADIVDSGATITANAQGESFDFDVDGDGVDDFNISVAGTFNGAGFPSVSSFFNLSGLGSNLVGLTTSFATYNGVNNYLGGFTSTFGGQSTTNAGVMFIRYPGASGLFYGVSSQFGLQFDIGGQTHFGAANFAVDANNAGVFTFQWETVAGRAFGAIPEPSSISLLALGVAGLAFRRKRN